MAALTVVASVLVATAHAVVSGSSLASLANRLGPAGVTTVLVESLLAVLVLGWTRRPPWLVAAVLTGVQLAQHLSMAGASHGSAHPARGSVRDSAHGSGLLMLLGHVAAASLTAALLGHGEDVVRLLLGWLAWLAPAVAPSATPARGVPRGVQPAGVPVVVSRLLLGARGVRGPPVRFALR